MNRAQMRDWIRRALQIPPPIDTQLAGRYEGQAPPWRPEPSNPLINQAIEAACNLVVREVPGLDQLRTAQYALTGSTDTGPAELSLYDDSGLVGPDATGILKVVWKAGDTRKPLEPANTFILTRMQDINAVGAGTPSLYAVSGRSLYILPRPNVDGIIEVLYGASVLPPASDSDTIAGLPSQFIPCVLHLAIVELGKYMVGDNEMLTRAKAFEAQAAQELDSVLRWASSRAASEYDAQLIPDTRRYRR